MTYIPYMLYSYYRIYFYRTESGRCQACDYARELDTGHQAKATRSFSALSKLGPGITADHGKYLTDGIWELRIAAQHHQHRFLYFFRKDWIVVTNAFLKKSTKVPPAEILTAQKARIDWMIRRGWEDL